MSSLSGLFPKSLQSAGVRVGGVREGHLMSEDRERQAKENAAVCDLTQRLSAIRFPKARDLHDGFQGDGNRHDPDPPEQHAEKHPVEGRYQPSSELAKRRGPSPWAGVRRTESPAPRYSLAARQTGMNSGTAYGATNQRHITRQLPFASRRAKSTDEGVLVGGTTRAASVTARIGIARMRNVQVSTDSGGPTPAESASRTEERAATKAQQVLRPTCTVRLGFPRTSRSMTYGGLRAAIHQPPSCQLGGWALPDLVTIARATSGK